MKLSVAVRRQECPFWQARYYDFNVFTTAKQVEKLRYMHRNPVARGLVEKPEEWPWSSYRHYATGVEGTVEIESFVPVRLKGWRVLDVIETVFRGEQMPHRRKMRLLRYPDTTWHELGRVGGSDVPKFLDTDVRIRRDSLVL